MIRANPDNSAKLNKAKYSNKAPVLPAEMNMKPRITPETRFIHANAVIKFAIPSLDDVLICDVGSCSEKRAPGSGGAILFSSPLVQKPQCPLNPACPLAFQRSRSASIISDSVIF